MIAPDLADLAAVVEEQPYPLLFATVSGARLYGFPSRDSDVDLRGAHLLSASDVVGLRVGPDTLDHTWMRDGTEIDLVTHDAAKFFRLLLRRNGYVLEQLLSPLVVETSAAHEELVALAPTCITRHHAHHYRGFASTQWRLFEKSDDLKPLLYTFRVLLSGIDLMRTGRVEAHLPTLLSVVAGAPHYLYELIDAKVAAEHAVISGMPWAPSRDQLTTDVTCLFAELDAAADATALPERPTAEPALHDLLVRLRLGHG